MNHPHTPIARWARLILLALAPVLATAQSLPPTVEADRQLKAAGAEMRQDTIDWKRALAALTAAEATGVKMPESFDFHMGMVLNETGDYAGAMQRLTRYLERYARRGRFYDAALEQLNLAERRQAQKLEAEQRARKADEDRIAAEAKAKQEQEEIDRSWEVRYFYYWIIDTEGRGYCSEVRRRIQYAVSSKATRNVDCQCRTENVDHPAMRGHTEDVCKGTFEINWKLDPKGDLSEQKRSNKWGIKFQKTPFNY